MAIQEGSAKLTEAEVERFVALYERTLPGAVVIDVST